MSGRHWTRRDAKAKTIVVALALAGAFLLAELVAADHHDCHVAESKSCAVCLFAGVSSDLPDAAPAALPALTIVQRSVSPVMAPPEPRLLFAMPTRGPPREML
ncbi:MAG: hypothetical protein KJ749_05915 [Planctomycetes bacterium]|nr:hypothetical protein [Planctomycetota bacterium]